MRYDCGSHSHVFSLFFLSLFHHQNRRLEQGYRGTHNGSFTSRVNVGPIIDGYGFIFLLSSGTMENRTNYYL